MLLAERWIMARLRDRRFTGLAEANVAIDELVGWVNDRPFKKLAGSRVEPPIIGHNEPQSLRVRGLSSNACQPQDQGPIWG